MKGLCGVGDETLLCITQQIVCFDLAVGPLTGIASDGNQGCFRGQSHLFQLAFGPCFLGQIIDFLQYVRAFWQLGFLICDVSDIGIEKRFFNLIAGNFKALGNRYGVGFGHFTASCATDIGVESRISQQGETAFWQG